MNILQYCIDRKKYLRDKKSRYFGIYFDYYVKEIEVYRVFIKILEIH